MNIFKNRAPAVKSAKRKSGGALRTPVERLESRFLLTSVVVNSISDTATGAGVVTLRDAINTANTSTAPTTITFDSNVFATAQTITLGSQLTLSNPNEATTLTAPAAGLTLSGNSVVRILMLDQGVTASMSGFTFANGAAETATIDRGGAIECFKGTLRVSDCLFVNNKALNFGAALDDSGSIVLTNVTMTGNTVGSAGGAISTIGPITMRNVTISGNTAPRGGGINVNNSGGAAITLSNTIVAGNVETTNGAGDVSGAIVSDGRNLIGNTAGSSGWTASDLTGTVANPLSANLNPLANNGGPTKTLLPATGSPAIGAGSLALIPAGITTDQRGLPRTVNGAVDIGAVEVGGPAATPQMVVVNSISDTATGAGIVTLRDAIKTADKSTSPTTITFDPTVFAGAQTITLNGTQLVLSNEGEPTTITGPAVGVTVSGNNASRVLQVDQGVTATLQAVNITRGNAVVGGVVNAGSLIFEDASISGNSSSLGGGGIQNQANLTLTNVTISNNVANGHGGGLENYGAALGNAVATLTDVTLSGNSTTTAGGGGIASDINGLSGSTKLILHTVTVTGNTSVGNGGGILLDSSNSGTTLTNVTVENNSAGGSGGGIANLGGTATVTNATVSGNTANTSGTSRGGGIYNSGSLKVSDTTVSGNSTPFYGGAIDTEGGEITLVNDTISGNSAGGNGGVNDGANGTATLESVTVSGNIALGGSGVTVGAGGAAVDYSFGATLTISNSIIAGNTNNAGGSQDPDTWGAFTSLGSNLIGETDGSTGWISSDLTGTIAVPLKADLGPLADNGGPTETLLPATGSPALGAGSVTLIPTGVTTDQRDLPRIVNGAVDIGAVEVQAAPPAPMIPVISMQPGNASGGDGQTVTFTAAASGSPTPTVQWQVSADGGTTYTAISGATSTTLTIVVEAGENGYFYEAIFTNSQGSVTSNPAALTVLPPGAVGVTAPNVNAGGGGGETITVVYTGSSGLIDTSTIGDSNLTITGPNGSLTVIGFIMGPGSTANSVIVTYIVAPPNGTWKAADNGNYNVIINAGAVKDVNKVGNAGASTSFTVDATIYLVVTVSSSGASSDNGQSINFIVTVSTGGAGVPTGTVLLFSDGTQIGAGPVTLGADGSATLADSTLTPGSHAITAVYSGDNMTYPSVTSALPQMQMVSTMQAPPPAPPLGVAPVLHGNPPASAVAGQQILINVTIIINSPSGAAFKDIVTATFYWSTDATNSANAPSFTFITKKVNLKAGKNATWRLKKKIPAPTSAGVFYLVIILTDAAGATSTGASASTTTAAAPFIDLSGAASLLPTTEKLGKKINVTISVTNNGNIAAVGPLPIMFYSSTDMTLANGVSAAPEYIKYIKIQPGKTLKFQVTSIILSSTTPGSYYLIGQLDPNNTLKDVNLANNVFVSPSPVTVG